MKFAAHTTHGISVGIFFVLFLCGALGATASERIAVPPPPGGGEGVRIAPKDLEGPFLPGPDSSAEDRLEREWSAALQQHLTRDKLGPDGDIGGDDVTVSEAEFHRTCSMDIASNGDIYIAVESGDVEVSPYTSILVFRSRDGGTVWEEWGAFTATALSFYKDPSLHIAEGTVDRCYVAYSHWATGVTIDVSYADLSGASATWTTQTAISASGVYLLRPHITSDAVSWDAFYLYVVAYGSDATGDDIWFTRSSTQGATFDSPYMIAEMTLSDRDYRDPSVSYGLGGFVHVAWHFQHQTDAFDDGIRYRRAANFANGGLTAWEDTQYLTSTGNDMWEDYVTIAASAISNDVLIAHRRYALGTSPQEPGMLCSFDHGVTWPEKIVVPGWLSGPSSLEQDPNTGNWTMGGSTFYPWFPGIQRAAAATPTVWSWPEYFVDDFSEVGGIWGANTALDPSRDFQVAAAWVDLQDPRRFLRFDAEWRAGPGYPNVEIGFPVLLDAQSKTAPAVVDVDGNGDLEIVFGDTDGKIQIYRPDGTILPGWPVAVGEQLSDSPVAIGDLRGLGEMYVVAGGLSGRVYCFDSQGRTAPGDWPFDPVLNSPAYVAIGAFGQGPYPRGIAVSVGNKGYFLGHSGGFYPGAATRTLARDATHAPAIGDVDGDGLPEVAWAHEEVIVVAPVTAGSSVFGGYMTDQISGSPTLGDFDLDGDYEVVVPLQNGILHVFDASGSDIAGFPVASPTASALSSAAIGQMLGNSEPEIVTAAREWTVHLVWYDGDEGYGWPNHTDGWLNYGSPIIGRVEGSSSDVVLGSRGEKAWAWGNLGSLIPGWPYQSNFSFYETPAMGDIDLDGSNEIVLLSTNNLIVVDVNEPPNDPTRTWGMAGHDPQRTGCSDCPEDLVTPVVDPVASVTRVSFAVPAPNPSSGAATFHFAVPGPAVASLEVFDIRGRRVSLVTREEVGLGHHVVAWGGLDDKGHPLASGLYFARLEVRGPGIDQILTRKLMVAR